MLASSTMITLKPSTPVAKLNRQSGEMLNDVTCRKSALPWSRDANKNSATANVNADAASAVFRAGAPSMIKTAATIGQKIVKRTISYADQLENSFCPRDTRKDAKFYSRTSGSSFFFGRSRSYSNRG